MILALVLIINATDTANQNINGITYTPVTVANETGYINSTGYIVSGASRLGFKTFAVTSILNATSNATIGAGNYTALATGVIKNATAINWASVRITYTYEYNTQNATTYNLGLTDIRDNTLSMVTNFFALMPTVGTILAVIILVAGIVILVLYVRRMKDSGSSEGTFVG